MILDMSPRAITERLRLVAQLNSLCLLLAKARPETDNGATAVATETASEEIDATIASPRQR